MIKNLFMGALMVATVGGTASANMPAAETPYRMLNATLSAMSACADDAREWSPRTLTVGQGSARAAGALFGTEDIFERERTSKNCAFV